MFDVIKRGLNGFKVECVTSKGRGAGTGGDSGLIFEPGTFVPPKRRGHNI